MHLSIGNVDRSGGMYISNGAIQYFVIRRSAIVSILYTNCKYRDVHNALQWRHRGVLECLKSPGNSIKMFNRLQMKLQSSTFWEVNPQVDFPHKGPLIRKTSLSWECEVKIVLSFAKMDLNLATILSRPQCANGVFRDDYIAARASKMWEVRSWLSIMAIKWWMVMEHKSLERDTTKGLWNVIDALLYYYY